MTNSYLLEKAKEALGNAYAPYSDFEVGAAVLTSTGEVFTGCNIENASYGASICAERTAIAKAVSEGYTNLVKIAIVCSSGEYAMPCGICRQVMLEFMADGLVIVEDKNEGIREHKVSDLIPYGFTL